MKQIMIDLITLLCITVIFLMGFRYDFSYDARLMIIIIFTLFVIGITGEIINKFKRNDDNKDRGKTG